MGNKQSVSKTISENTLYNKHKYIKIYDEDSGIIVDREHVKGFRFEKGSIVGSYIVSVIDKNDVVMWSKTFNKYASSTENNKFAHSFF